LADRYLVTPDVRGPKIRLGLLWTVALFVSLVASAPGLAVFLGLTVAVAALQTSARWRDAGASANQWLAAGGALVIVVASSIGNAWSGAAVVAFAVVAVFFPDGPAPQIPTSLGQIGTQAWGTLAAGLCPAVVGVCAVQLERIDALTFLCLVGAASTYDAGNFLCTEGRRNPWIGPLAGMGGVVVVAIAMAVAQPPPFSSAQALLLGLALVVLCPAGQMLGSWLLPRGRAHAPALRRLDSWLLAGPLLLLAAWIAQ
jgi:uncharacterized membrane protein YdcZ (DUF606 family)